ncbi:MAG: prolipoprotein diacylglyceryl transferase [Gemmatimonadaceae bacterium]|nr:prolipoprotein diacylglyceryl transferase [Gemmatimonadaceae bacterium]
MTVHQPFLYSPGGFQISGFGIGVLFAFIIAQVVCARELARRGHDPTPISELIYWAAAGGIVGAKLYYAVLMNDWSTLLSREGFVFWGGLIGGILAVSAIVVRKRLGFHRIADVAGLGIAAAYSVGRTGCWAVGDDYGRPSTSFFAVSFPQGAPPSTVQNMISNFGITAQAGELPGTVLSVHPTQLYETAMGFGMFLILWRLRDHRHAEGWLFGVYMVVAGVERFLIEFMRAKDDRFFGVLTMAQMIALAFMLLGAAWMYARRATPQLSPSREAV